MKIETFKDRVAFVTGGAQGIGLGIARSLAKRGVALVIADVKVDALAAAEKELGAVTDVVAVVLDVRDRDAYAAVADDLEARLGPVSLLFNNAGVAGAAAPAAMSYASWDWVIGVNLQGVYNGVQTFIPRMIGRGGDGYMVNTASGAGLVAMGASYLYTTSKYAVVGLSESLHLELAPHGIGVSVLCPGPVATKIIPNTADLRPSDLPRTTGGSEASSDAEAFLAAGANPNDVGEWVLDAMRVGRLHIYTDDIMETPVKQRTEQLLAALPSRLAASPMS